MNGWLHGQSGSFSTLNKMVDHEWLVFQLVIAPVIRWVLDWVFIQPVIVFSIWVKNNIYMFDVIGFWSDLLPVVAVSYLLQLLNGFGLGVHIASPCIFYMGQN